MLIAQISDLHVRPAGLLCCGIVDSNRMLADAVAALLRLRPLPDLVLATGDLVDGGEVAAYEELRRLLAPLPMPVYLLPGNHDRREGLRAVFGDAAYLPAEGQMSYAIEAGMLRILALDTSVPKRTDGTIGAAQLGWLEARLAEAPGRPTMIAMHHPPFPTGIVAMDRLNCTDGAAMAPVVARYPNVERVLCGHHHRAIQIRWAGTIGSIAPSTAHQITLDLEEGAPLSFHMEPPSFHLHAFDPAAGLITHQVFAGTFPGPHSFGGH